MLCPHCANSPPSQISTVSGSRSTSGRSARNTSAGCSRPGVCAVNARPRLRPAIVERDAHLREPAPSRGFLPGGARDQRLGRRAYRRSRRAPALALLLRGALDQRDLRDRSRSPARSGSNAGAGRPLDGEIERLAEQHDQIGARVHVGECAERRIRDAARAFQMTAGARSPPRAARAARGPHVTRVAARRKHDRPLRRGDRGEHRVGDGAGEGRARDARARIRPADGVGSRPSRPAGRTAGSDAPARAGPRWRCAWPRRCRAPSVAADVAVHDALVTGAAMSAWRISWKPPRPSSHVAAWPEQQHHRAFGAERRVQRADRVGVARPARHHRDARPRR